MEHRRRLIQDINSPPPRTRPSPRINYKIQYYTPAIKPQPQPHPTVQRTKRRGKLVFGISSMLIIAAGAAFFLRPQGISDSNSAMEAPKVKAAAVEEIKQVDFAGIDSQISAIIAKYPSLQISVAYTDIKSTTTVKTGVEEPYIAASTAKLLTAVLYLQQVQQGKYTLDTRVGGAPARDQLRKMIEDSDNPSWDAFNKLLTKTALNQFASSTGLTNYKYETNTSTPSDIALLLEKLYKNQLLSQENTKLLLSYMQHASESQYIPAALPADYKVFHKAGYLKDRAHDAAIVDDGKNPFVLVIFTKSSGAYNFELGKKIMHEITSAVLSAYIN